MPRIPPPVTVQHNKPLYLQPTARRTLRYTTYYSLTSTSGVMALKVLSANGLFDPDITGTGHQPMSFDQMMAMYIKAYVLASRCTIDIYQTSAVPTVVCLYLSTQATLGYGSYESVVETGVAEYKLIPAGVSVPLRLTKTVNIRDFLNRSEVLDDDTLATTASANPADQVYFMVTTQDANQTSTTSTQVVAVVDYDVVFTDPAQVAGS